jgi:3-isopropylmalate/(R)-2-methylmalate dehydratase small subunit
LKNGLVPIILPPEAVDLLLGAGMKDTCEIEVNLDQQLVIGPDFNQAFQFDPFRRYCLLNGIDDLDYLLSHQESIAGFFAAHEGKRFFSTPTDR